VIPLFQGCKDSLAVNGEGVFHTACVAATGCYTMLIHSFLEAVLASMFEPFTLFGCVLAGSLLGKLRSSLLFATLWAFLVQYFIIMPRVEAQQWAYRPDMPAAGVLAALLATATVHYIANRSPRAG